MFWDSDMEQKRRGKSPENDTREAERGEKRRNRLPSIVRCRTKIVSRQCTTSHLATGRRKHGIQNRRRDVALLMENQSAGLVDKITVKYVHIWQGNKNSVSNDRNGRLGQRREVNAQRHPAIIDGSDTGRERETRNGGVDDLLAIDIKEAPLPHLTQRLHTDSSVGERDRPGNSKRRSQRRDTRACGIEKRQHDDKNQKKKSEMLHDTKRGQRSTQATKLGKKSIKKVQHHLRTEKCPEMHSSESSISMTYQ